MSLRSSMSLNFVHKNTSLNLVLLIHAYPLILQQVTLAMIKFTQLSVFSGGQGYQKAKIAHQALQQDSSSDVEGVSSCPHQPLPSWQHHKITAATP